MKNKTKKQAKEDMKGYNPEQFELYVDNAGWESWMEEYTDAQDGEECTEREIKEIKSIQKEMWEDVQNVKLDMNKIEIYAQQSFDAIINSTQKEMKKNRKND